MADNDSTPKRKPRNDLTAEYVRSILDYDPETGVFRWRWREDVCQSANTRFAGQVAGRQIAGHRVIIGINGHQYLASRLAYLIMTGAWPTFDIDHRNTDDCDNRWTNLRPATHLQNTFNRRYDKRNRTGVVGVRWHAKNQAWEATIGKTRIGQFKDFDAAVDARMRAVTEQYGQFAHPDLLTRRDSSFVTAVQKREHGASSS